MVCVLVYMVRSTPVARRDRPAARSVSFRLGMTVRVRFFVLGLRKQEEARDRLLPLPRELRAFSWHVLPR